MINKLFKYSGWMLFFFAYILFFSGVAFSQLRDTDEMRLEIGRMGLAEQEEVPVQINDAVFVDKEIKYVAGEDKEWFSDDDAVYEHYQVEHDATGKVLKRSCYKVGKDMTPFTYDDELQNFQLFEYGFEGKLLKETSYDGKSVKQYVKQYDVVYSYDEAGKKIKAVRYDPRHKEIRSMTFSYAASGQLTQDVESVGKDVEKYHRFEYDGSGHLVRTMEYHREHDGKGPDGAWFTPDDVISSTKESFYNGDGRKAEDNKYISPGADGKWFTKDDGMQYYVLFEYQDQADL